MCMLMVMLLPLILILILTVLGLVDHTTVCLLALMPANHTVCFLQPKEKACDVMGRSLGDSVTTKGK